MIIFKTLRYRNFLASGNAWTTIELCKNPTTIVVGDNGAGKSTMLDAICYALYNKAFRNINKPQLINSINNKNMIVELSFSIGANEFYIRRGMKPNLFEIFFDGNLINQDAAAKDYQDVLEKQILKMNFRSFCQVVILGSASYIHFMSLPLAHRREIIEDLLDLQIFTKMNVLVKDYISKIEDTSRNIEYDIKLTQEKIKLQKDHIEKLKINTTEIIEQKMIQKEECVQKISECVAQHEATIKEIQTHTDSLRDEGGVTKFIRELESAEKGIVNKQSSCRHEIEFFSTNDECPTCNQTISTSFKEKAIEERVNKGLVLQDGLEKLYVELEKKKTRLREIQAIHTKINTLTTKCAVLNTSIKTYTNNMGSIDAEIASLHKNDTIDQIDDDLQSLSTALSSFLDKKERNLNTLETHRMAASILKDSGIKSKIIKQFVPVMNKLINKYLHAMNFFISFELDDQFKETIKSRFRDEFSYASFSEGEKSRINVAILLAWRDIARLRNSAACNLLIFDEILDSSLDNEGTDDFLRIIQELTSDVNVYIISHKTDPLMDKFDRVLSFTKVKNFSIMEEK